MSPELTQNLWTLAPAALSGTIAGLIAWLASRRSLRSELKKMQFGLRHIQAGPLQAERLKAYPSLYKLISATSKKLQSRGKEGIDIADIHSELEEWDSSHALILSVPSTQQVFRLRGNIANLALDPEALGSPEAISRLIVDLEQTELTLKSDVAVFGLDLYNPETTWKTYGEVEEAYDRRHQV